MFYLIDILLYGASGTGKTYIINAIQNQLGVNSVFVKGPEILNKYIGASEQTVRDKFSEAESKRPCLLIFEELDAVVPTRNSGQASVTDRIVNQ